MNFDTDIDFSRTYFITSISIYINKILRPKYGCSTITPERLRRSQQMWSHFKALDFLQITEGLKWAEMSKPVYRRGIYKAEIPKNG